MDDQEAQKRQQIKNCFMPGLMIVAQKGWFHNVEQFYFLEEYILKKYFFGVNFKVKM